MIKLLVQKIGMTQIFGEKGGVTPVTMLYIPESVVVGKRTIEKNGYDAVIFASLDLKIKKKNIKDQDGKTKEIVLNPKRPHAGFFDKQKLSYKKVIYEVRDFDKDCVVGDVFSSTLFEDQGFVDVSGFSKGKGFQGVMKKHGFSGGPAGHGSKFHREAGGVGTGINNFGRLWPQTKMAGRMGHDRCTVQNLKVVKLDTEKHLIFVQGAVPGPKSSYVMLKNAVKKQM